MTKTKEYRLSLTEEAKKIVENMTLEEKVDLMSGNVDAVDITPEGLARLLTGFKLEQNHYNMVPYEAGGYEAGQVPAMKFCDGPRGVVCGNHRSTCFPVTMARGASFDTGLEKEIGRCIGREVRAFGGNLFAGVCVNLPYHPGWGRSQETYGEESFHLGAMGAALTEGVQEEDVIACVKHFAFNSMENARFKCSVTCDPRTEKEVFLPHFKDCIDAGAACVMSSYNRYNSVYCGHSRYLLTEILKRDWDFDGFVMSDFIWGVRDTVEAANGGQDMEMRLTMKFGSRLVRAVRDGFVPEERIDDAATRIVRTLLAFDREHKEYDESVIGCAGHIAVAKRAAEESITLIKNEQVLPFRRKEIKRIALIGKLADTAIIGDHGSSQVRPAYIVTPKEGLKQAHPEAELIYEDGSDRERAKKAAADADAVVIVAGCNFDDEGEFVSESKESNYLGGMGGDRKDNLGLHADEIRLIQEAGSVNPKTVVVLVGGSMIMMTEWIGQVPAVIMAYYPGMEGGAALAEILYGDVNPSGKLPFVVPYGEEDLPPVDWEASDQYYEYYHGYTRLEKLGRKPLYPYGHGLSYTEFSVSDAAARVADDTLFVSCILKNVGPLAGKEVVQLYVGFENSAVDRPKKQLRGFRKVFLEPGEEAKVEISCPLEKLKWYHPAVRRWELEQMAYTIYVGTSSDDNSLIRTQISL